MAAYRVVYEYVVGDASGYGVRRVLLSERLRTLTQHDMLPQHPVNIMELFCECFLKWL